MANARVMSTEGHPVVYADWNNADGKPTVLIYGHYDVQPVQEAMWGQVRRFSPGRIMAGYMDVVHPMIKVLSPLYGR